MLDIDTMTPEELLTTLEALVKRQKTSGSDDERHQVLEDAHALAQAIMKRAQQTVKAGQ